MLKIGSLKLKSNLILAPMSGCTDFPFRTMARAYGCELAFYEMLDSSGLTHNHKKTLSMLKTASEDSPIAAQILGPEPGIVLEAAHIVLAHAKPVLIDLNCACPAKKVLKKKAGAYLLKEPKTAAKIIKKLSSSLPLPITVKIRSGWDKNSASEGLKLAKIAQENGASAVFIHGRTVAQEYSGRVDYDAIAEVKKALKIPIIASGDILTPQLAKDMLEKTGCDGLLIARGGLGRPWIFVEIEAYLKGRRFPRPSISEIKRIAEKHLKMYKDYKGDIPLKHTIGHMRKIAMWYTKGLPYSKRTRQAITKAERYEDILAIIDNIL